MASKLLVDELAPYAHATDVTITTGKNISGANTQYKITGGTSGQVLKNDGSDGLTWNTGGKVIQVLQTIKTDTTSTTVIAGAFEDISGMNVVITPAAPTSKVLVFWTLCLSAGNNVRMNLRLVRDLAYPFLGDAYGSRVRTSTSSLTADQTGYSSTSAQFLDSPNSAVAVTYKLQWAMGAASTMWLNRGFTDSDTTAYQTPASTLTVMEIAA